VKTKHVRRFRPVLTRFVPGFPGRKRGGCRSGPAQLGVARGTALPHPLAHSDIARPSQRRVRPRARRAWGRDAIGIEGPHAIRSRLEKCTCEGLSAEARQLVRVGGSPKFATGPLTF
jgi:hypothetical protein